MDEYGHDCDVAIKDHLKKVRRKLYVWVSVGVAASIALQLTHWLLEAPEDVQKWQRVIDVGCGLMVVIWILSIPVFAAIAVVLELRGRFIYLNERLDSLDMEIRNKKEDQ